MKNENRLYARLILGALRKKWYCDKASRNIDSAMGCLLLAFPEPLCV